MEAKELTPSAYEEIKGSLIRHAIDKGMPDPTVYEIAKDVAEISYKAGYNKALAQLADMTEECKQIGRKEVVWWVKQLTNNPICQYKDNYLCLYKASWQAKLKEWGIK